MDDFTQGVDTYTYIDMYMLYVYIYISAYAVHVSGQIIIFDQPSFPWNKGSSLPYSYPFGERSCEVAIIWLDDIYVYIFI